MVIPPQFNWGALLDVAFNEGFAAVRVGDLESGKWGYIDRAGKFAINPQFRSASRFSDGLAAVQTEQSGPWGYIDKTGAVVINPQFDATNPFSEGLAAARIGDKWGYISR